MKKVLLLSFGFLALTSVVSSCNKINDCKDCEVVTYDVNSGDELSRTAATEYCGASLTAVEMQDPVIVGDEKTVYECH
jgi:hypothetical protein